MQRILFVLLALLASFRPATAQVYDAAGNDVTGLNNTDDRRSGNFNPHNNDTTHQTKQVPKGLYVWTVDRKFGDIRPAEVDTMPHLFPLATMNTGMAGQYNTTGNNYSARLSRIFNERPTDHQFALVDAYSYVLRQPDEFHFTNTLSPITNLWYDNCGDKTNGEDHIFARFAVNAGKRLGMGFNFNYAYARGYFSNQNISHFNGTAYLSYLGDRYQAHALFSTNHQKAAENGGISSDYYITDPELFSESFSTNEIPTELTSNWNRDHNYHFFLTHRYSMGFYRDVPMTEAEIEARKFAEEAKKEQEQRQQKEKEKGEGKGDTQPKGRPADAQIAAGRPEGARIAGDEPSKGPAPTDSIAADSTRISVTSKEQADSLLSTAVPVDSAAMFMKKEFVPVTSFIHTLELDHYEHIYQAYSTPDSYYVNTYYINGVSNAPGDSIYDTTRYLQVKNTAALALLEGFNKWAKAGIKAFATHQLRRYDIPTVMSDGQVVLERWTEQNVSIGGQLQKTQGKTLHYNAQGEIWMTGEDAGQVKLDFQTDLNFPFLGDTVTLAAKAHFYNQHPDFFFRHFHSKHIWWDNSLNNITRTKVEGLFAYEKTRTKLRLAVEELQNYTYLGMAYDYDSTSKNLTKQTARNLTAQVMQYSSNLNVLTAQIEQPLALGPLHWDNTVTYQSSSNKEVLPLPALNVFSNLYLKFVYAHVLAVELGAAGTWFTKYYAPDFCPQLNQYAIQQTAASRIELGNQPFIDLYANLHLKHARFFVMMSNVTGDSMRRMNFLTPHYPLNTSVLHLGVSWNFFN